jgi:capsular polysaccharide biosynthesis protein
MGSPPLPQSHTFSGKTVEVAPAKLFTYPTRLAGAWHPEVLEIYKPGYRLNRPDSELRLEDASTESLNIKRNSKNLIRWALNKMSPSTRIDNTYLYDTRFDTDKNIAHILTNVSPTVLLSQSQDLDMTLILRKNASEMALQAYKLLGFNVFCTDRAVDGSLIQIPEGTNGRYEGWYRELFNHINFQGYQKDTPARVFLSRKGKRTLLNESEVEAALQGYGFHTVYFEDLSLAQQWSIARNAEVMVAIHGAALSSLVFNQRSVKLLELFHPGYVVDMYRHMTNAIGGTWCGVAGKIPKDLIWKLDEQQQSRHFALSPFRVDLGSLSRGLESLGS